MSRKDQKKPKSFSSSSESKTPKYVPYNEGLPEFRAGQMDMTGPWGWDKFDPLDLKEFFFRKFSTPKS